MTDRRHRREIYRHTERQPHIHNTAEPASACCVACPGMLRCCESNRRYSWLNTTPVDRTYIHYLTLRVLAYVHYISSSSARHPVVELAQLLAAGQRGGCCYSNLAGKSTGASSTRALSKINTAAICRPSRHGTPAPQSSSRGSTVRTRHQHPAHQHQRVR